MSAHASRPASGAHPVLAALRDRPAGARLALVVEGGGMRGAVSGGMALALGELGLAQAFDDAFGASAGTLNALWLISGRVAAGIPTWVDPEWVGQLIRPRRALAARPVVDVASLIEERYERHSPGLFQAALASGTALHPVATDVETGRALDLHPFIDGVPSLRAALRASATLPLLAGPPVRLAGRRFVDAGLSAAIPVRAALEQGATHVLVLRSRQEGETVQPATGLAARVTAGALRRVSPAVAEAFLTRAQRELEDEDLLARHARDPSLAPHVLSVRPAPGSVVPARLERDVEVVRAGLRAGHAALRAAFDGAA